MEAKSKRSKAEQFVLHMMRRCQRDGRLAWLIGPLSEGNELMVAAYAEMRALDLDGVRKEFNRSLRPVPWPKRD